MKDHQLPPLFLIRNHHLLPSFQTQNQHQQYLDLWRLEDIALQEIVLVGNLQATPILWVWFNSNSALTLSILRFRPIIIENEMNHDYEVVVDRHQYMKIGVEQVMKALTTTMKHVKAIWSYRNYEIHKNIHSKFSWWRRKNDRKHGIITCITGSCRFNWWWNPAVWH